MLSDRLQFKISTPLIIHSMYRTIDGGPVNEVLEIGQ